MPVEAAFRLGHELISLTVDLDHYRKNDRGMAAVEVIGLPALIKSSYGYG